MSILPFWLLDYIYATDTTWWLFLIVLFTAVIVFWLNVHKYYETSCPKCSKKSATKGSILSVPFFTTRCPSCGYKV